MGEPNPVAVLDHARDDSALSAGLKWLEDGKHPLDWNGPTSRVFTRFRDEDLNRPIIEHLERVARRHPNRVAVTDAETSLSYAELWDGLSGLAETIATETKPGDLIGIVLPTSSMCPLAMLACLAAGRLCRAGSSLSRQLVGPGVGGCAASVDHWTEDVLEASRPQPTARVIHLTRLPQAARNGWRPTELGVDSPHAWCFGVPAGRRASSTASGIFCSGSPNPSTPRMSTLTTGF